MRGSAHESTVSSGISLRVRMHHYNIVLDSTLAIVESAEVIVVSTNSVVEYEAESEVLERVMAADKTDVESPKLAELFIRKIRLVYRLKAQ